MSLLLTMVVLYYSVNVGRVWWRYYALLDRMTDAARFALNQSDDQILRGLREDVINIGLPAQAQRFRLVRSRGPLQIIISTQYQETIQLPFVLKKVDFKPSVTQRL